MKVILKVFGTSLVPAAVSLHRNAEPVEFVIQFSFSCFLFLIATFPFLNHFHFIFLQSFAP